MLVAKNHQKIRSRYLVHEFSYPDFFNDIKLWLQRSYIEETIFCGCFRFTWLWLLIAIMKRCAERCAL